MPVSNYNSGFPQGVTIRNVPILDLQNSYGNVFWVDSTKGSDDNKGTFKYPLATLQKAVSLCTADQGDKIFVAAGHSQTIVDATTLDINVAGIQIFGLGVRGNLPRFFFSTDASASIIVSAANVYIGNIDFFCDIDSQVTMLDCNARHTTVENCLFSSNVSSGLTFIDVNGGSPDSCNSFEIRNCRFFGGGSNYTAAIELGEEATDIIIDNCWAFGTFSDAAIHNPTGNIITNLRIIGGSYSNYSAGNHAIELVSACVGVANDIRMYSDSLTTIFDPGSLMCNGCYGVAAVDTAGTPIP